MLCSVILTKLTAVFTLPTELGSGTIPMELKWEFWDTTILMNFIEIEEYKLYVSIVDIIDKAYLQQKDFSDVKYQILIITGSLFS